MSYESYYHIKFEIFFFFENLNEHFLGIGIFCKKPETGRFLFLLAHILAYMVFAYLLPEVRNHL
jgi:hypothetical protein